MATKKQEMLNNLDRFTEAYLAAALWSSLDDKGKPLDKKYNNSDFTAAALAQGVRECKDFQDKYGHLWEDDADADDDDAGHHFWLNRNRNGEGFWAGDYEHGEQLSKAAHRAGERDIYVAGGKLHFA